MKPHPYGENNEKTQIPPGFINSMGYVDESEVDGPGSRAVL
jgi:anaerobic ribonucleoside-triphosphate reductase activating protein